MKKYNKFIPIALVVIIVLVSLWGLSIFRKNQALSEQVSDVLHKNRQYELMNDKLSDDLEEYLYLEKDYNEAEDKLTEMTRQLKEAVAEKEVYKETIEKGGMALSLFGQYFFQDFPDFDYGLITTDLRDHPELIGVHAVLGGTMHFDEVHLLSDRLVYGTFSDGHIVGEGVYGYSIGADGQWHWEEIVAYPDTWNPNLRAYISEGKVPSVAEVNDDQVSISTNLEDLLSHYTETLDGAYAENYAYMLFDFYKYTPIDHFLMTLSQAGPLTKEGAMELLSYEIISMGDQDGIGVDYLLPILEDMGTKGDLDRTFVDNFKEILAQAQSRNK